MIEANLKHFAFVLVETACFIASQSLAVALPEEAAKSSAAE